MDRRDWLRAMGTAGLAGVSGCLAAVSDAYSDLTRKRVFEFGEFASHDGLRVTTTRVATFRVVRYRAEQTDDRRVWHPGDGKRVAIASYRVEKDRYAWAGWPDLADFLLVTDGGVVDPRRGTPDGASVYSISTPADRAVRRPRERESGEQVRREWDAVYVTDSMAQQPTTKWAGPPEPVFWMPAGR